MSAGSIDVRVAASGAEDRAGAVSKPRGRTGRGMLSPSESSPCRRGRGSRKASFAASPRPRMTRSARSRLRNAATCMPTKVAGPLAGLGGEERRRVISAPRGELCRGRSAAQGDWSSGDHWTSLPLEERHAAAHVDQAAGEAVDAPREEADGGGGDAYDVTVGDGHVPRTTLGHGSEVDGERAFLARGE